MEGDPKIFKPQIPASAGDTASSVSGGRAFPFQALGEKRWPKQNLDICRCRFWQIQIRLNPSNQQDSPTPPLRVPPPLPLCLPYVDPKKSLSLVVQLPGPKAMDLLQPLPDALLLGSPSVAFYVQSLHRVHAHPFLHSIRIPRSEVKHILGRGGRVLSRIEDLSGCLISVVDSSGRESKVNLMGGDATLGCFLVHALSSGFFSVFETLERNGITRVCPEWFAG